jgi:NADH-quinone oxidoreductase subunit N
VAVVNTVASVFYYLRWITPVVRRPDPAPDGAALLEPSGRWGAVSAYCAAVVSLLLGVLSGPVLSVLGG